MGTKKTMYNNTKLTPQLNLAPQLLNWLKILQASTHELSTMIQHELASNPALEAVDRETSSSSQNGRTEKASFYGSEMHLDTANVGIRLSILADLDEDWSAADEQNIEEIRTLDPAGRNYQSTHAGYGVADLEIVKRDGELHVEMLDDHLPKLQLSDHCKRLLKERSGSKQDMEYIRQKMREANFLIQGISQRQDTMLTVARHIMHVQHEYFTSPDGQLQPLTMNKVAATIGVHETTVSRAIANKYVQTDRGIIEMRTFFKVGYRCEDGTSVVAERVMEMVAGIIRDEDPMQPVIDSQISEHLKNFGLKVARRTVAKYREEMNIPSSKERLARARRRAEEILPIAV